MLTAQRGASLVAAPPRCGSGRNTRNAASVAVTELLEDDRCRDMKRIPEHHKKIRATIRRYERSMKKEQAENGYIRDGYGKRFLLGSLYLQLGDLDGALEFFAWYEKYFPDDWGDPFHYLCWALALFKAGDPGAKKKLILTMLRNLYLIPHLLGIEMSELNIWHGSNLDEQSYLEYLPEEDKLLWDKEALAWAKTVYEDLEVQDILKKFVEIKAQLKNEPPGPRRSRLVDEGSEIKAWIST